MIFYKYQGTGNDFIIIDGYHKNVELNTQSIKMLCDRHFGIGSDGLIILRKSDNYDFRMEFFNPDGSEATFCGNGGRCIVRFAYDQKIIGKNCTFEAKDGIHIAEIKDKSVKLSLKKVLNIRDLEDVIYLNTGTHHVVLFVKNIDNKNITSVARPLRYDKRFAPEGTNVNLVEQFGNTIKVRTYEKGVEAETLSCGTGVVASAIATVYKYGVKPSIEVDTKGGKLHVDFNVDDKIYDNIYLTAPANYVFKGEIKL